MQEYFTRAAQGLEKIATKMGLATQENMRAAEEDLLKVVGRVAESWAEESVWKDWGNNASLFRLENGGFSLERVVSDPYSEDRYKSVVMIGEEEGRLSISSITEAGKTKFQRWDEVEAYELTGQDRLDLLKALV